MLLRRLFATTTGAIVSKGAAIVMALVLFHELPTADMGRYTAALTLVSFCAIVGNAGLNPLITREVARRGNDGWGWWASIAPLRLLLGLGAYGLLALVALFVPGLVDQRIALVAGALLVPDALAGALAATLGGMGKAALASWLDALSNVVGLAATLALVLIWHAHVLALAWLAVAMAAWALVFNGWALAKQWRGARSYTRSRWRAHQGWRIPFFQRTFPSGLISGAFSGPDAADTAAGYSKILPIWTHERTQATPPSAAQVVAEQPRQSDWRSAFTWERLRQLPGRLASDWKYALAAALPLGIGALAATLYFRVDTLFLSAARGAQAVAYYSAPYQIVEAFWLISTSWNAVMLPVLARRFTPRFVERSIGLLLCIGLPASLAISCRAADIVTIVFGPTYLPAALPLRWVIWVVPILFSYVPLVTALFVHDHQRGVLYVLLANLALVLVLDALLIPPFGLLGASIATVVVEAGGLGGYLFLVKRADLGIQWTRGLGGPVVICLPIAAVLIIGQSLPFMFIMPAVLMLWAALFALFHPWSGWEVNPQFFSPQGARSRARQSQAETERSGREHPRKPGNEDTQAPTDDIKAGSKHAASQGMVIP
jgi:O-antigen/teichoic acid export membrane protein